MALQVLISQEVAVRGDSISSFDYYRLRIPNMTFSSTGTAVLSFYNTANDRPTREDWRSLEVTFNGIAPAGLQSSDSPNRITWPVTAAIQGDLVVKYTLCEITVRFRCDVCLEAPGHVAAAPAPVPIPAGVASASSGKQNGCSIS